MKKFLCVLSVVLFPVIIFAADVTKEEEDSPQSICPKTKVTGKVSDCLRCHVSPSFALKETDPQDLRAFPVANMWVLEDVKGIEYGKYLLQDEIEHGVTGEKLRLFFQYLDSHDIKVAVIDIQSFGGSVFEGWRCKSVIEEFQAKGIQVTTRVNSIAASAATMIFLAADKRLISPTAELMFHELWSFTFLSMDSPSDKEDEARVLRHIQDGITAWVSSRCNLSKSAIDERIRKKEFWVSGKEARDYGMATGYIGK